MRPSLSNHHSSSQDPYLPLTPSLHGQSQMISPPSGLHKRVGEDKERERKMNVDERSQVGGGEGGSKKKRVSLSCAQCMSWSSCSSGFGFFWIETRELIGFRC